MYLYLLLLLLLLRRRRRRVVVLMVEVVLVVSHHVSITVSQYVDVNQTDFRSSLKTDPVHQLLNW